MKMELFLLSGGENPPCAVGLSIDPQRDALRDTRPPYWGQCSETSYGRGKTLIGALETYGAGGLEIISASALEGLTAHK